MPIARACVTRDDDVGLREKLRELANQRRRFGYRRLHILLRREGGMINRKKTQRLYREEGLTVRRRRSRRRAVGTGAPAPVLALSNQRWSLELGVTRPSSLRFEIVHDQMASGRRFRVLNMVDEVTRECLVAVPDTSISGRRVVREFTALIERRSKPGMTVSDNGTGIAAGNRDRIFDPFFTTRRDSGGTGMGLSIVHTLLAARGARIELATTAQGASFSIRF